MILLLYFVLGLTLGYIFRATRLPKRQTGEIRPFMTPDTVLLLGDGTRVRWGDIPADKVGRAAWLNEHCKCGKTHA